MAKHQAGLDAHASEPTGGHAEELPDVEADQGVGAEDRVRRVLSDGLRSTGDRGRPAGPSTAAGAPIALRGASIPSAWLARWAQTPYARRHRCSPEFGAPLSSLRRLR
jgi:hypothetical protein